MKPGTLVDAVHALTASLEGLRLEVKGLRTYTDSTCEFILCAIGDFEKVLKDIKETVK